MVRGSCNSTNGKNDKQNFWTFYLEIVISCILRCFLNFIFQSLRASFVTVRATRYIWLDDEGYKLQQTIRQLHVGHLHKLRTSKKILIFLLTIKSLKNA